MDEMTAEAEEAKGRAALAEAQAASQIESNDALLRRLLEEQRARFEEETAEMRAQLSAKTAAQQREVSP